MGYAGTFRCSWSLAAAIASFVMLISLVHFFMSPLLPYSIDYFSAKSFPTSCAPNNGSSSLPSNVSSHAIPVPSINLEDLFPADSFGAVMYRGAPWKAETGRWLSGCDNAQEPVEIVETIGNKDCESDCSFQGVCNKDLGQCRCFHGYSGEGCTKKVQLGCNLPSTPNKPFGPWMVSICSAHCDTTRAMCFCGKETKYPDRPVAEACGFEIVLSSAPDQHKMTNWSKADHDNIFTTNTSKKGWCNVDPTEAYAGRVNFKEECDCKYDGLAGRFCEIRTTCSCVNQCSDHGKCRGGACQCENGWYGVDCSIPSSLSPMEEWPKWLRPSKVDLPIKGNDENREVDVKATVTKKRPLLYVYDLPPDFNSNLLEGRHFKFECVNRIYNDQNRTLWTDQLYGAQMALYESILASAHRTLNGEEADYFYVPVLDSCIITRADDAPHFRMPDELHLRSFMTLEMYKKAYDHIRMEYPYWNRTSGKDHIWFFSWDEGACYAPKEIWNSMMLVHWGNTNSKYNHSTTAYWYDNWDNIPQHRRGNHSCFDPKKDLVLPAWKVPNPGALKSNLWSRDLNQRKTLFYFNGNLGPAYTHGRPESTYSMGIRQKVAEEFGSTPNKEGRLGRQYMKDVIVTPERSHNYLNDLASSKFCGVFPGDGWSGRMEDSILQGCIPVIIQDGIFLPYENMLNYDSFAVRLRENEIPNMIQILQSINETKVASMLANIRNMWQRFLYRDAVVLEAERQKRLFGDMEDWGVQFSKLTEDDVFSTFIQVLHYKLHNDPWRKDLKNAKNFFGLQKTCL